MAMMSFDRISHVGPILCLVGVENSEPRQFEDVEDAWPVQGFDESNPYRCDQTGMTLFDCFVWNPLSFSDFSFTMFKFGFDIKGIDNIIHCCLIR